MRGAPSSQRPPGKAQPPGLAGAPWRMRPHSVHTAPSMPGLEELHPEHQYTPACLADETTTLNTVPVHAAHRAAAACALPLYSHPFRPRLPCKPAWGCAIIAAHLLVPTFPLNPRLQPQGAWTGRWQLHGQSAAANTSPHARTAPLAGAGAAGAGGRNPAGLRALPRQPRARGGRRMAH